MLQALAPAPTVGDPWILFRRPSPQARVRLFCFHHAGGNALAFRPWVAALPAWIDVCPVQLPGRSTRLVEAPYKRITDLAEDFVADLAPLLLDMPVALFGHSMGAAVACAVAQQLRAAPVHVFAAGRLTPSRRPARLLHQMNDASLASYMRRLGGTPEIVFSEPDLLRQIMTVLRADLRMNDFFYTTQALPGKLTVLGGETDPEVPPQALDQWRELAPEGFWNITLPGGHFFTTTATPELHDIITAVLAEFAV